ncbi:hypothetical protein [Bilophila wadsworthia]|uniref:hypothetical protein n=1 Tax=Bilophila wadsworthia TaxID=35833 RepID=UPI00266F68CC|nr:hypothetical protein [Bilophila wadsworthia]
MKYRKLTENGDYAFGRGGADMHADTPEAVGQAVLTRLRLFAGLVEGAVRPRNGHGAPARRDVPPAAQGEDRREPLGRDRARRV